jgi:hypothetical protein
MDWKDIKPLKEYEARLIVKNYFLDRGFSILDIDPRALPPGKKPPDFIIKKDDDIKGYCEVKTPANIINPITNLYQWDTAFYKLRKFSHKARKQFDDYDPSHTKPWIIVFTSNHPQLNWKNFFNTLMGAVIFNGKILRDFRNMDFTLKTNKDLLSIDLILWFQINYIDRRNICQTRYFVNKEGRFTNEIKSLLNDFKSETEK